MNYLLIATIFVGSTAVAMANGDSSTLLKGSSIFKFCHSMNKGPDSAAPQWLNKVYVTAANFDKCPTILGEKVEGGFMTYPLAIATSEGCSYSISTQGDQDAPDISCAFKK
jgi:hypothetical protein